MPWGCFLFSYEMILIGVNSDMYIYTMNNNMVVDKTNLPIFCFIAMFSMMLNYYHLTGKMFVKHEDISES